MTVQHKSPECVTLCTSRERPIVTEYSVYFYDVENAQVCIHVLGHHLGVLLQQTQAVLVLAHCSKAFWTTTIIQSEVVQ